MYLYMFYTSHLVYFAEMENISMEKKRQGFQTEDMLYPELFRQWQTSKFNEPSYVICLFKRHMIYSEREEGRETERDAHK